MTWKFTAASKLAVFAAAALVVVGFSVTPASAQTKQQPKQQPKQQYDKDGRIIYGPGGPNRSYQQGPHTRIYITTRSWLDAGTEVLPGDRKFTDYAFPQARSFGMENKNRPLDRIPLNPPSDLGGYPTTIPLY